MKTFPEKIKAVVWRVTENKRAVFYPYAENVFRKALNAQIAPFVRELSQHGVIDYSLIVKDPIENAFLSVYARVGTFFAAEAYGTLTKSWMPDMTLKRRRRRFIPTQDAEGLQTSWLAAVRRFVFNETGNRISSITRTTVDLVKKSIETSLLEGFGIDKAARELVKQWRGVSLQRAKVVSRTEVLTASNAGSFIGARSTGLDLWKVWLSTKDSRTRDSHRYLDGEKADMEEEFSNGLRYPGDPRGSASETILCRCTQTYEVKE